MRTVLPLLTMLLGCPAPQATAPQEAPIELPVEEPNELITDVQHLLGEAAALQAAGRYVVAEAAWQRAYNLFRKHLLGHLRKADPTSALSLEYRFGQLRTEVNHRRGRPEPLARRLERVLEDHRHALVQAMTPRASPSPGAP